MSADNQVSQAPRVIDISRTIAPDVAVYPGDDPLGVSGVCEIGEDAPCQITALQNWTTHFLTHVDPPSHFIPGGKDLGQIDLSRFYRPAIVVEVSGSSVSASDVPTSLDDRAILFKTSNSHLKTDVFHEDHVYISRDAVEALVASNPTLVGFDYLSVDRFGDEEYPVHRGLLGSDILILEGLDLSAVAPGEYVLSALPLKIAKGDGSPVRAVLIAT